MSPFKSFKINLSLSSKFLFAVVAFVGLALVMVTESFAVPAGYYEHPGTNAPMCSDETSCWYLHTNGEDGAPTMKQWVSSSPSSVKIVEGYMAWVKKTGGRARHDHAPSWLSWISMSEEQQGSYQKVACDCGGTGHSSGVENVGEFADFMREVQQYGLNDSRKDHDDPQVGILNVELKDKLGKRRLSTGTVFGKSCRAVVGSAHAFFKMGSKNYSQKKMPYWTSHYIHKKKIKDKDKNHLVELEVGSKAPLDYEWEDRRATSTNFGGDYAFGLLESSAMNNCPSFDDIQQLTQEEIPEGEGLAVKMVSYHRVHNKRGKYVKKEKIATCFVKRKKNPLSSHFTDDKLFYHDCDSNGMASGGLIYIEEANGRKIVVGIHRGGPLRAHSDGKLIDKNKEVPPVKKDGSEYNELDHSGMMVSMWGNRNDSDENSPAALWEKYSKY